MISLIVLAVFVSAAAIDFFDASNVRAVIDGNARRAAVCSMAMYLLGCIGLYSVVEYSWWLIVPECMGLYVRTHLAIARQAPKIPSARVIPPSRL